MSNGDKDLSAGDLLNALWKRLKKSVWRDPEIPLLTGKKAPKGKRGYLYIGKQRGNPCPKTKE
jgi:hypothetical protein